ARPRGGRGGNPAGYGGNGHRGRARRGSASAARLFSGLDSVNGGRGSDPSQRCGGNLGAGAKGGAIRLWRQRGAGGCGLLPVRNPPSRGFHPRRGDGGDGRRPRISQAVTARESDGSGGSES